MKKLLSTVGMMVLLTTFSLADDQPATLPAAPATPAPTPVAKKHHRRPDKQFSKLDTNNDGVLTLEEFKAGPKGQKNPAKAEKIFRKMDVKGDGKVTLEEFKSYEEDHVGKGGNGKKAGKAATTTPASPTPASPAPAPAPAPANPPNQ